MEGSGHFIVSEGWDESRGALVICIKVYATLTAEPSDIGGFGLLGARTQSEACTMT